MEQDNINLEQTICEMESWKQQLASLQQENSLQKNELVKMLKNNRGEKGSPLEIAERYQNLFLQQDETFRLMWNDLTKLERSVTEHSVTNVHHEKEIKDWRQKLKKEMQPLDITFDALKKEFSGFIDGYFPNN